MPTLHEPFDQVGMILSEVSADSTFSLVITSHTHYANCDVTYTLLKVVNEDEMNLS